MKVKVFSGFQQLSFGKDIFGRPPRFKNIDEIVEAAINEWLASRPGIRIVQVQQSSSSSFGTPALYVSVWYEENVEPGAET